MTNKLVYDVIVVGAGLIGAAALRHFSTSGGNVLGIGPDEPTNWQTHTGVYASHYDQGRITRRVDPDFVWSLLGARAIDDYATIEGDSDIPFHGAVGCLRVTADASAPDDSLTQSRQNGVDNGAVLADLDSSEMATVFPFFHLPDSGTGVLESRGAGYINPPALIEAQLAIARQHGANRVRATATELSRRDSQWHIHCDNGEIYGTSKLLVTTGAFTNGLLPKPLDLRPRSATTLLAEVSDVEAQRLAEMPSVIYRLPENPLVFSIYALPPIRYPDGKLYLKIGHTYHKPLYFPDQASLCQWYKGQGEVDHWETMNEILFTLIPNLQPERLFTRPCAVTHTAHERPYIDMIDEDLYVAVGGCGGAAKSSPEIGKIAAMLVEREKWTYDVAAETFSAVYQKETANILV